MWHTLEQTKYLTDIGYIQRMIGPVSLTSSSNSDVPTPYEFRAISEIHRLRRAHSAIIEGLKESKNSFVVGSDIPLRLDEATMGIRTVLLYHIDTVRKERARLSC